MAGTADEQTAAQDGQGAADGGVGDAPKEEPKAPAPPPGLSEDILPEILRGRPASEIQARLSQAFELLPTLAEQNKTLKEQIENLSKAPPKPPEPEKDLKDLILDDPETAVDRVVSAKYGDRFANLGKQVAEMTISHVGAQLPDWEEHKELTTKILHESGSPINEANIKAAYHMAYGRAALEKRIREQQQQQNVVDSDAPGKTSDPGTPPPTDLEREVASVLGFDNVESFQKARTVNVADEINV